MLPVPVVAIAPHPPKSNLSYVKNEISDVLRDWFKNVKVRGSVATKSDESGRAVWAYNMKTMLLQAWPGSRDAGPKQYITPENLHVMDNVPPKSVGKIEHMFRGLAGVSVEGGVVTQRDASDRVAHTYNVYTMSFETFGYSPQYTSIMDASPEQAVAKMSVPTGGRRRRARSAKT